MSIEHGNVEFDFGDLYREFLRFKVEFNCFGTKMVDGLRAEGKRLEALVDYDRLDEWYRIHQPETYSAMKAKLVAGEVEGGSA